LEILQLSDSKSEAMYLANNCGNSLEYEIR